MAGSLSPRILSTLSDCPFLPIVIYTVSGSAKSLGDKPDTDTERLPRSLRQALRCQRISFEVTSALGNWNDQLFASQPSIDIYGSLSFELRTQVSLPGGVEKKNNNGLKGGQELRTSNKNTPSPPPFLLFLSPPLLCLSRYHIQYARPTDPVPRGQLWPTGSVGAGHRVSRR